MTLDDHRKACIKEMAFAWLKTRGYKNLATVPEWMMRMTIEEQTVTFDALRAAGVRVNPVEATEEMLHAARNYFNEGLNAYDVISAAGDLTKPAEKPASIEHRTQRIF